MSQKHKRQPWQWNPQETWKKAEDIKFHRELNRLIEQGDCEGALVLLEKRYKMIPGYGEKRKQIMKQCEKKKFYEKEHEQVRSL